MGNEAAFLPAGTNLRRTIKMNLRLEAPPERVSRAWTDPEELARWLPEEVDGALALGTRSTLVWRDHRVWWDVTEVETGRVFAFRRPWLPTESLVTTVRVTFRPLGYGTRLRLEEGVFPLDQPGGIDAWADALQGWGETLVMLRAYLDFSTDVRRER